MNRTFIYSLQTIILLINIPPYYRCYKPLTTIWWTIWWRDAMNHAMIWTLRYQERRDATNDTMLWTLRYYERRAMLWTTRYYEYYDMMNDAMPWTMQRYDDMNDAMPWTTRYHKGTNDAIQSAKWRIETTAHAARRTVLRFCGTSNFIYLY